MITVDAAAENTIVISPGANATLTPADVVEKAQVIAEAGALGLCLEVSLETVTAAARCAHEAGVPVVLNVSPARPAPSPPAGANRGVVRQPARVGAGQWPKRRHCRPRTGS